ncbi:MAG: hypothetical protein ACRDAM_00085, partial [Casimicrobium sp.]
KRPGLLISLSPAVHPWAWDNYLLDWPTWAAWTHADRISPPSPRNARALATTPRWDEIVPQAYRFNYDAFEKTWLEQHAAVQALAPARTRDLVAGIRLVGEGKDSSWEQLEQSIALSRRLGNGGHVHWFSRGVLDIFSTELTSLYQTNGAAHNPHFPKRWRSAAIEPLNATRGGTNTRWRFNAAPKHYRLIAKRDGGWIYVDKLDEKKSARPLKLTQDRQYEVMLPNIFTDVRLLVDRRRDMRTIPACRVKRAC